MRRPAVVMSTTAQGRGCGWSSRTASAGRALPHCCGALCTSIRGAAMTEPLALTLEAAAEALSVSPRTVRRLLDAGELGRVKIGRAVRVSAASVRAYVERQTQVDKAAVGANTAGVRLPGGGQVETGACRTGAKTARSGGPATSTTAAAELDALLAQPIEPKRTRSKRNGRSKPTARATGKSSRAATSKS
ncbi:hypothetical protein CKO31_24100 [Thiohalocapsa halophila]|uniref:Helix-turn-helix domain-containing protein n=1 Tax=Thiohalocapsa halophila TaxID=69359 RepID=A0ABS1CPA6_9GAMM|nr:hypothetical protein [Thiohalocapsa halophila]